MSNLDAFYSDETSPLPDLFCQEDDFCIRDEEIVKKDEIVELSESDCEFVNMSMQRETRFQPRAEQSAWLKCARLDMIKWIIDTAVLFGYQLGTAYLAMVYFDWFCARRCIDDVKLWTVRLLSIACLSLAAKMEETEVRALSEYHIDEYNFEWKVIQKMELLVFKTLEWNLTCVTPFGYLDYFVAKFFAECRRRELLTRAGELVMSLLKEINAAENRPSIVAAAAVLAAYDHQLPKNVLENMMDAIESWSSQEKELASSCYDLLQEIVSPKPKTPKSVLSMDSFSPSSSSTSNAMTDDSTAKSIAGTKRRLTYTYQDQHCTPRKISKP